MSQLEVSSGHSEHVQAVTRSHDGPVDKSEFMMAYRSAKHESTGVSPHEMVFGHAISLPVDLICGKVPSAELNKLHQYLNSG